ncbi:hypothetical protein D3C80_1976420 [compost metagenome]
MCSSRLSSSIIRYCSQKYFKISSRAAASSAPLLKLRALIQALKRVAPKVSEALTLPRSSNFSICWLARSMCASARS